jgi:hypothetical protein
MRKIRTLLVLAALICFSAFGVASAQAEEWAGNGYHLEPGQNGFLNRKVWIYAYDGEGLGGVLVCTGIRGLEGSEICSTSTEEIVGKTYLAEYYSEPYLHNHSTKGGDFRGWWY